MRGKSLLLCTFALAGALAFAGCQHKQDDANIANPNAGADKLFTEPTQIDIVVGSHASWPYNENWKLWQYFQEETGANFHVQAIPNKDLTTKVNLMLAAPDSLPDMVYTISKPMVDQNALDGAFVPLDEQQELSKIFTVPARGGAGRAGRPAQERRRKGILRAGTRHPEDHRPTHLDVPQGYL